MAVTQIERMEDYLALLQRDRARGRDASSASCSSASPTSSATPPAFEALAAEVLPPLVAASAPGDPLRVWVPGCSTGEEAYSIAMLAPGAGRRAASATCPSSLRHRHRRRGHRAGARRRVSRRASPPTSRRSGWRASSCRTATRTASPSACATAGLRQAGRDQGPAVLAARPDQLPQPAHLHGRRLQQQLMPAVPLRAQPGRLPVPRQLRDGRRRRRPLRPGRQEVEALPAHGDEAHPATAVVPTCRRCAAAHGRPRRTAARRAEPRVRVRDLAEQTLLEKHVPACGVINAEGDVLYIHGHTGRYLEPPPGEASGSILKMAREGLRLELAAGVRKVLAQKEAVRYERLRVQTNGGTSLVNLIIEPMSGPDAVEGVLLVLFEDAPERRERRGSATSRGAGGRPRAAHRATWTASSRPRRSTCAPPSRSCETVQRGAASRPTRRCSPPTRSCSPPTRSSRPRGRSCSRSTRSSSRSTASCSRRSRSSRAPTTT